MRKLKAYLQAVLALTAIGGIPGIACAAEDAKARDSAELKIANRTIIVLRGPIAGHYARERADGAQARIRAVLDAQGVVPVTTEETPQGTQVLVGGKRAFVVTAIDVDESVGETTPLVAREAVKRLEAAIAARAEQRSPRHLARSGLVSLAAALVLGALVWLILRLRRVADSVIARAADEQTRKLREMGLGFGARQVLALTRPLLGFAAWLAVVVLAWGWLAFVLGQFPYTLPYGERLADDLLNLLG